jgi:hypothetical protein
METNTKLKGETVPTTSMSVDLNVVREVMYLRTGEVNPGNEVRVMRLERKLSDWYCNVCKEPGSEKPTREDMLADLSQVENSCEGYWCEGEKCVSVRTHWVMHSSKRLCWDCSHDPCACSPPLVWDEVFSVLQWKNQGEHLDVRTKECLGKNQFQTQGKETKRQ